MCAKGGEINMPKTNNKCKFFFLGCENCFYFSKDEIEVIRKVENILATRLEGMADYLKTRVNQ